MRRLGSPGEGRIGCLLWMAVLGVAVMIAWTAVPVKLNDVEFGDFLDEQAQFSRRASLETVRGRILKKAKELEIPLEKKQLKIEKNNTRIRIQCSYKTTLDFPFFPYEWEFTHDIDKSVFSF